MSRFLYVLLISIHLIVLFANIPVIAQGRYIHFSNRWAILIGVGDYAQGSGIKPLDSPAQDVNAIKSALLAFGGFEEDQIISLVDSAAIGSRIEAEFSHLKDRVGPDDLVLFYFSGRGTRTIDELFREEPDNLEEWLLPYDAVKDSTETYIRDDNIGRRLLPWRKAKHTVVIIDVSYTGNGEDEKGFTDAAEKGIDPEILDGITKTDYLSPNKVSIIEACGPSETTIDGLFTNLMVETMQTSDGSQTLAEILERVQNAVKIRRSDQHVSFFDNSKSANRILLVAPFVEIIADPPEATVTVNGDTIGWTTPLKVTLGVGAQHLKVARGNAEWDTTLSGVRIGRLEPIYVRLEESTEETEEVAWIQGIGLALLSAFLGFFLLGLLLVIYSKMRLQGLTWIEKELQKNHPLWARALLDWGYRVLRRLPDWPQGQQLKNYSLWAEQIEEALLSSGEARLDFIPSRHRDYAGQTYAAEHREFDLVVDNEKVAFRGEDVGAAFGNFDH